MRESLTFGASFFLERFSAAGVNDYKIPADEQELAD
jgi:hypothetical protein